MNQIRMTRLGKDHWLYIVLATTLLLPHTSPAENHELFDISDLHLPETVDSKVIPAFITNPTQADLIVLQTSEDKKRSLKIFSLAEDGRYIDSLLDDIQIDDDALFIDIGKVRDSSLDYIILFKRNAAWWVNPYSGEENRLTNIKSIYKNVVKGELPRLDVVNDINGDSLDDILLPGFDGYLLYLQSSPGVFAEPVLFEVPPRMGATNECDFIWYRYQKPDFVDVNYDQRNDFLIWDNPELRAFLQTDIGSFSSEQQSIPLSLNLEGAEDLSYRFGREDQSDIQARTFDKISDINADMHPDLTTISITSEGVFKKRTTFEFFMGYTSSEQPINFPEHPNTMIRSNGIQFDAQEKDFNNDGMKDFVISSVELGFGKILGALLTKSISIDLDFYQLTDSGYPDKPNITHKIRTHFNLSSGEINYPTVLVIDINGDQMLDLVVQDGDALEISYGDSSERLFSRAQDRVEVAMPLTPGLVDTFDLNKDNKTDIILRYQDKNSGMDKVVKVLLSK